MQPTKAQLETIARSVKEHDAAFYRGYLIAQATALHDQLVEKIRLIMECPDASISVSSQDAKGNWSIVGWDRFIKSQSKSHNRIYGRND